MNGSHSSAAVFPKRFQLKRTTEVALRWFWWACALTFFFAPVANAQVAVLTHHNDPGRTGQNLNETILNTSNVNVNLFGKLFACLVDGQIYAQPLYVPGVVIPAQGTHNVVYVATENNSVYAFDADSGAQLWNVSLGTPVPSMDISTAFKDLVPVIGITSTPVIDLGSNTIYVVAKTKNTANATYHYQLHALDITTGIEKLGGPVEITASVPGTGLGSVGGNVAFQPLWQLNRPGLLLLNGVVYMAFGSQGDLGPYHGWVLGYNASTLQQVAVFNTTPNGDEGAIWQAGQGLAADVDNIYLATGNGVFDASTVGGKDYGDSVVRLVTSSGLSVGDYFTPSNQSFLDLNDIDLGAGGPMLIPGTSDLVLVGKDKTLRLINNANMGKFNSTFNNDIQEFQPTTGTFMGGVIYWNSPNNGPVIYLWGPGDVLKAFKFTGGQFQTSPVSQGTIVNAAGWANAAPLSLSANGSQVGTGIVWAAGSFSGNSGLQTVPGILRAFDATDLTKLLWDSKQNAVRDDAGTFAKFSPPTIANGKVYLPTFSGELIVYGLNPPNLTPPVPPLLTATATSGQVSLGWTASAGATSYNIKRSNTSGGPYSLLSSLSSTSYLDSAVTNGTTYYYVVTAINAAGESGNSNEASATPQTIVFRQSATGANTGSTTARSLAFNSSTVPGNAVIANCTAFTSSTTITVTDSQGNTYSSNPALTKVSSTLGKSQMFYATNIAGGSDTVTCNFSPASQGNIMLAEFSGLASSPFDSGAGATGTGTLASVGPAVTSANNDLIVGWVRIQSGDPQSAPPGLINMGGTAFPNYWVYGVVGAAGSYTLQWPLTSSTTWLAVMGTFKAAGTPTSPPPAPTNLQATAGNTQVSLSWTASAGASSYNVKRSTTSGGPYSIIANTTSTTYTNTGLVNGTTYYYVVSALNSGGESGNSNQASATPTAGTPPPISFVQSNVFANTGSTTAKSLAFNAPTTAGNAVIANCTAFTSSTTITVSDSRGNTYSSSAALTQVSSTLGKSQMFYATNIVGGSDTVTCNFSPASQGNIMLAEFSGLASSPFDSGAGAVGTGTLATAGPATTTASGNLIVGWLRTSSGGPTGTPTGFINMGDTRFPNNWISGIAGVASSYSIQWNLSTLADWLAVMGTFKAAGAPTSPPPAPTNLQATAGNTQVALSWTASAGASSYNVKRSTTSGGPYSIIANTVSTSFTNTGLVNGTTYYYVVSALNSGGESGNSNQASATPTAGTPPPISFVQSNVYPNTGSTTAKSLAFNAPTTAGNAVIANCTAFTSSTTITVSDSRGNTYSSSAALTQVSSTLGKSQMFYATNIVGGSDTVTCIFSPASQGNIMLAEFSGLASSPFDSGAGAVGTGTLATAGPATTTVSGDLIVGWLRTGPGGASTPTGFVNMGGVSFPNNWIFGIAGAPGSYSIQWNLTTSTPWLALMGTFKP